MNPAKARLPPLAFLALCGLASGCPDTASQLCPTGSKAVGSYTLSLAFQPGNADECRVTSSPDGGALDASLGTNPSPRSSALCIAPDGGGAVLYLAVEQPAGPTVSGSPLGDGGTFSFTNTATVTTSACGCSLSVTETIAGQLHPPGGDGGVAYDPDAGLGPVAGFSGTTVDKLAGGADCHCPMPCSLDYVLTGTRQ